MNPADAELLRREIAALGFDVVRFATVAPPEGGEAPLPLGPSTGDFAAWLEAGNHADMDWLARGLAKRADIDLVLPGARSIIALGVNYLPADAAVAHQQRWAKYALHADYHDAVKSGLHSAGRILESRLGFTREDYRVYVDTGPVLERGWAARGGLGWQGKNGMLISREHGNWLFLAVILVRAALPPDEPLRRSVDRSAPTPVGLFCGSCTRCLDACPTAAFPRPGWVDARRCISYHTIENRGVIPRELRARFGGRVFGCDTCLDVCPWNRFAQAGRSALLSARTDVAGMTLLDLLEVSEDVFRAKFRRTSIKRTGLVGLLRNACIAAGNWDDTDAWHFGAGVDRERVAAALERLCAHDSEIVRVHAVWALFRLLGRAEADARTAAIRGEEHSSAVLAEYAACLS